MSEQWHVGRDGQQYGPFSTEELKQQAGDGRLLRTDLVWKEGMPEWVAATKVKGLFPEKPATPPPVPTQPAKPAPPPIPSGTTPPPSPAAPPKEASDYIIPLPAFLRKPLVGNMHNQRLFFIGGAGLTLLSMLFTWVRLGSVGFSGFWLPAAYFILFLTIPAFVLSLLGNHSQPLIGGKQLGAAIPSGIAALISFVNIFTSWETSESETFFGGKAVFTTRPGFGLFIAFLVTTLMTAGAWLLVAKSERAPGDTPWMPDSTDEPPSV